MDKLTEYQELGAPILVETRNVNEVSELTGNIYETCVLLAHRADDIAQEIQEELHQKLEDFALVNADKEVDRFSDTDIFEDEGQIALSRSYERLPKPTLLAVQELENNMLTYSYSLEEVEAAEE